MQFEIVLQNRDTGEVDTYLYKVKCAIPIFVKWVSTSVHPITLSQWFNGDKPTLKTPEDIIPICVRCEFGEIWRRPEDEIEKIKFYKGLWFV